MMPQNCAALKWQRMVACAVIAAGALGVTSRAADVTEDPLAWPKVTNETRPWTRWWWLGSISTEDGLRTAMEQYAAVGLGGLEITPIYGVRGYEDQFINYLTPRWMSRLDYVLSEGKRLGLGIDMATGNGWPFGGPWVGDDTSARYLAHTTYTVAAGQRLGEPIVFVQKPILRFAGPTRVPLEQIKDPVSANDNLQELALDQVRFEKPIPLHALLAFSEKDGAPVDLTRKVGPDGTLDWTAPADGGTWTLYALFEGWHGKQVERAGPGGEGNVIDHFRREALEAYLDKFDDAFKGHDIRGLRGFFNDSYEVDDANGESDFTADFFNAFRKRRGYDLRAELPALLAGDAADEHHARVLADYRETVSDLLLDEFTAPWRKWAAGHGAIIRNQAHGSPANLLDLYAASDIPEQEGDDLVAIKMASSAAHVMGKPLTSAEACTWLNEHFQSTLSEAKRAVDLFLLGGVNHVCYHGTAYSPPDDPWPGFQFYASTEFNPANPFWRHFASLNRYVARVQSFLQAGTPDEDVLVYYNIHDRWAEPGNGAMPHFHGRAREGVTASAVGAALVAAGYGFDFISDRQLAEVSVKDGILRTDAGTGYRVIVVPPTKRMPVETLEVLAAFADKGAKIVFAGGIPEDVPGWGDLEKRRAEAKALAAKLQVRAAKIDAAEAMPPVASGPAPSRSNVIVSDDAIAGLAAVGVARERMVERGLRYVRRGVGGDRVYFIQNGGEAAFHGWVPLAVPAEAVGIFMPMSGRQGLGSMRVAAGAGAGTEVLLQLAPGESCVVKALAKFPIESKVPPFYFRQPIADPIEIKGRWQVDFLEGGPELPESVRTSQLLTWTAFGGDAVKAFSGTARYSIIVDRPKDVSAPQGWWIDLGNVGDSARVKLNGVDLGTVFMAPFRVHVPDTLLRDKNELEVEVSNLAANRIAYMDREGIAWKKFYNTNMPARRRENTGPDRLFSAAAWAPRPSGLLSPVHLVPLMIVTE